MGPKNTLSKRPNTKKKSNMGTTDCKTLNKEPNKPKRWLVNSKRLSTNWKTNYTKPNSEPNPSKTRWTSPSTKLLLVKNNKCFLRVVCFPQSLPSMPLPVSYFFELLSVQIIQKFPIYFSLILPTFTVNSYFFFSNTKKIVSRKKKKKKKKKK